MHYDPREGSETRLEAFVRNNTRQKHQRTEKRYSSEKSRLFLDESPDKTRSSPSVFFFFVNNNEEHEEEHYLVLHFQVCIVIVI
jgi:hypothetical protein